MPRGVSMARVEIFTSRKCGWAQRNYAALVEKSQPFELVPSKGPDGKKTAEFLSLTPLGLTPVMRHGGAVVWESTLINLYIDAQFDDQSLMPDDPADATMGLCRMHYCDQVLQPALSEHVAGRLTADELKGPFDFLDRRVLVDVSARPYWYGTQFTLVDLAFLSFFRAIEYIEQHGTPVRSLISDRVQNWGNEILERESVVRAAELAEDFRAQPRAITVAS